MVACTITPCRAAVRLNSGVSRKNKYMATRKTITKKLRFEVFKRDSFACQYCGRKAPEVLLHVDHIDPVASGGTNELLNLITACFDCNSGKSDRKLSDNTVLDKQRQQLGELQERREQIEMMFAWQQGLAAIKDDVTQRLSDYWAELVVGFSLNENGRKTLKKLERQFSIEEIMESMRIATDTYIEFEDKRPTQDSVEIAWQKIGGICTTRRREAINPDSSRIYYIRGILRNRLSYCNETVAIQLLRKVVAAGGNIEYLEDHAKEARTWTQWTDHIYEYLDDLEEIPEP